MKLYPPAQACKIIDVEGAHTGSTTSYKQRRDGAMHVEDKNHIKALRDIGCIVPHTRVGGKGYRCNACGFSAVFSTCGRCGSTDMTREG